MNRQISILIALLIIPGLVLTVFWFRHSWELREDIDQARKGLVEINRLEPLLVANFVSPDFDQTAYTAVLENVLDGVSEDQKAKYEKKIKALMDKPTILAAADLVQRLTFDTARSTDLTAMAPSSVIALPRLLDTELLKSVVQTDKMTNVLRRMSVKEAFNPWDRMAVPVQAGQFKMRADIVAVIAREHFYAGTDNYRPEIVDAAQDYRQRNVAMQRAFGAQVRLMPDAQTGAEIELAAVDKAHDDMIEASIGFWMLALQELRMQLDQEYNAYTTRIRETAFVGGAIVLVALALALLVGSAFRHRTLQEIAFAYLYDEFSGLPNRRSLVAALKQATARHSGDSGTDGGVTIYHLDLAKFTLINDTYGEQFGDSVLLLVVDILSALCEEDDTLYRVGGNAFALLRFEPSEHWRHDLMADKIQQRLADAARSMDETLVLSARIGVATGRLEGLVAAELLNEASIAVAAAKLDQDLAYRVFEPELRDAFRRQNSFESELNRAIENDHIEAWLQPQVLASTGAVVGAEALVRWVDPDTGIRLPHTFLPLAEETGLIERIDEVVRRKALSAIQRVNESCDVSLRVGLNASAQLLSGKHCAQVLEKQVRDLGLSPDMIDIEVLESVAVDGENADTMVSSINSLAETGFRIDLDDFGTGRASISSLRDLQVDRIKIDRSFVTDIHDKKDLQIFTNALIQLARSLNIRVLAEGIESKDEMNWLRLHGCQYFQGYHFAKPMPEEDFVEFVRENALKKSA